MLWHSHTQKSSFIFWCKILVFSDFTSRDLVKDQVENEVSQSTQKTEKKFLVPNKTLSLFKMTFKLCKSIIRFYNQISWLGAS